MNLLAIETSSSACSVALQKGDEVRCLHQIAPMQQAKLILPSIQQLLADMSLSIQQLNAIAFGCGPGSFTGIRIASSVAQGLGFAYNLPLIPISSLAALAQTAVAEHQKDHWLVLMDARMDQVYWAVYAANQAGLVENIGEEQLGKPEEIRISNVLTEQVWYGVGDGWEKFGSILIKRLANPPKTFYSQLLPHAQSVLQLARAKWQQGNWVKADKAMPVYLR